MLTQINSAVRIGTAGWFTVWCLKMFRWPITDFHSWAIYFITAGAIAWVMLKDEGPQTDAEIIESVFETKGVQIDGRYPKRV